MCAQLVLREYPGFRPVEGTGGDEGVDGWVPDRALYFQFHAPVRALRKSKVRSYLERVSAHGPRTWVLVTNHELTRTQWRWLDEFQKTYPFKIEAWGPAELTRRLSPHSDLRDYYLGSTSSAESTINIATQRGSNIANVAVGRGSQVTIKGLGRPKVVVSVAGTIASDARKHNYIMHLVKRYNEYKEREVGKENMRYSLIRVAYEREIGSAVKLTPLDLFERACQFLQGRIARTKYGRMALAQGQKLYSTFEEYRAKY